MQKVKKRHKYLSLLLVFTFLLTMFQGIRPVETLSNDFHGRILPDYEKNIIEFRFKADGKDYAYVAGPFNEWKPWDPKYKTAYKMEWKKTNDATDYWELVQTIPMDALGRPKTKEEYEKNKATEFKFVLVKLQNGQEHHQWAKRDGTDHGNDSFTWEPIKENGSENEEANGVRLLSSSNTVTLSHPVDLIAVTEDDFKNRTVLTDLTLEAEAAPGVSLTDGRLSITDDTLRAGIASVKVKASRTAANGKKQVVTKTISVSSDPSGTGKILTHFFKQDGNYHEMDFWNFTENPGIFNPNPAVDFTGDSDLGKFAYLSYEKIIVRKKNWSEQSITYTVPENAASVYLIQDDGTLYTTLKDAYEAAGPQIKAAMMDGKESIQAFLSEPGKAGVNFELFIDGVKKEGIPSFVTGDRVRFDTSSLGTSFDPRSLIEVKADQMFRKYTPVTLRNVLDGYVYTGDDMGVSYDTAKNKISFRLWAPTAHKVELLTFGNDADQKEKPSGTFAMLHDSASGTYHITVNKEEADKKYYLYRLFFKMRSIDGTITDRITYAVDPYAIATGLNGNKGYVTDIDSAELKPQGFDLHPRPDLLNAEDSIVYEMHVRDFTIDPNRGGAAEKAGKFIGIAEEGTKLPGTDIATGLDHLAELGVTHVHLLPIYDIGSIDEDGDSSFDAKKANGSDYNRNWGYDPKNYNVLEGSYSTDPGDPSKIIKEFRKTVQALHKKGIRVVLDQVYNHMQSTDNMDNIVPRYYFRTNETGKLTDGAGCGNEVATERPMVRKFIVDSNKMWLKNYKVDGLRFDLMALIDKGTMNAVKDAAKAVDPSIIIYGEPWAASYTPLRPEDQTKKNNPGIAAFNDDYRNALRGDNSPTKGFVQGNTGEEISNKVQEGLRGSVNGTVSDPDLMINYVEAHDNYCIFDQIEKSEDPTLADGNYRKNLASDVLSDWKVKKSLLANGFVLTSQGIPFFQGGSELLRTKQGDHNSYKSSDSINAIHWADKATYQPVFEYYRDLIKLRKEHPAFRLTSKEAVKKSQDVYRLLNDNSLILQHLKNNANGDKWKNILVLYNGAISDKTVTWLPKAEGGNWKVIFDGKGLHDEKGILQTIPQSQDNTANVNFTISSSSLMVLFDEEGKIDDLQWDDLFADQSIDYMTPLEPSSTDEVTVRFRAAKGDVTSATLHYYDEEDGEHQVAMQKTADSFYSRRDYDKEKIEFWEGKLPAGTSTKYYNFEVKNERIGKIAWISGGPGENNRGITRHSPKFPGGIDYGFSVVPDYKTPDWAKESVFYQIMVDRFRDGDKTNNRVAKDLTDKEHPSEISPWGGKIFNGEESDRIWNNQFFGGDLIGVKEALPYLKDTLGVDALYLMPIFQSGSDHKYDADDHGYVDKHFGGNQALSDLSAEMKKKGMKLVLDGVFNHTSTEGALFKEHKEDYYFYKKGAYRDNNGIPVDFYPWHGFTNLAKLDYSKDAVRNYIYKGENAIAKRYLKAPYEIAGWRLDAAEDVNTAPRDYKENPKLDINTSQTNSAQRAENLKIWQEFHKEIRKTKSDAYILGEFWGNDNQWYYGKAWDSKMNYGGFLLPFLENNSKNPYLGKQSLDNKNGMSVADIGIFTRNYFKSFPYQTVLSGTNSISTHDKERFLNREYAGAGNTSMMELAAALQLTFPGIPMIYYGDEIGMIGEKAKDPYNRGTFDWNAAKWSPESKEMLNDHRLLVAARKKLPNAFVYGAFEEIKSHRDDQYLVYARYGNGSRAIVVLNNSNKNSSKSIELPALYRYGFKNGEVLKDVLSGNTFTVSEGKINLISKDMSAMVLVPEGSAPVLSPDVTIDLPDFSDGRVRLASPESPQYEEDKDTLAVSWKAASESHHAKEISVRIYSPKNTLLSEKRVPPTETKVTFVKSEVPHLGKGYEITVQVIADREKKLSASAPVDDAYADSGFALASEKKPNPPVIIEEEEGLLLPEKEKKEEKKEEKKKEDSSDKNADKEENESEKVVLNTKKSASLSVGTHLLKELSDGLKKSLTVTVKDGSLFFDEKILRSLLTPDTKSFEVSVKVRKEGKKEKVLRKKLLRKGFPVTGPFFTISVKINGKKEKNFTFGQGKLKVTLFKKLKQSKKTFTLLDVKTGKKVKAKFNRKKGRLTFKTPKTGTFVILGRKKGKK